MLRGGSARRPITRAARRWIAVAAIVVVLGAGTAAWAATRGSGSPTTTSILATASRGTIKSTVSATGTLQPARQADLGFAVSGTVRTVSVAVGDRVRTGQVLATVGAAALRADRAAAAANLTAAQSQLAADTAAGAADTQLTSDDAAVSSARSTLTSAQAAVRDASLRATFSGRVATVDLAVGDSVAGSGSGSGTGGSGGTGQATGSSTTSAGTITVISTSAYVVDASVGSSDLASLKKGLQAQITPTGSSQTLYGTVSSVGLVASSSGSTSGSSSSGSATFPVTIAVTGDVTGVYAGSSADVSIIVKQVPNVLTVPTAAVHSSAGKTTVTVSTKGKQVVTPVTIGQVYGAQTEITAGLTAGQQVVVTTLRLPTGTGGTGTPQNRFGGGGFGPGGGGGGPFTPGGGGGFGPGGGAGNSTGGNSQ